MQSSSNLTKTILEAQNKLKKLTPEEKAKYLKDKRKEYELSGDLPPGKTFAVIDVNTIQYPKVLLRYWGPALSESCLKTLNYITDKTFGYDKGKEGDAISMSQMLNGIVKNGYRIDWGVGVGKRALIDALAILEILGLIEVTRSKKENGDNNTNLYRVKVYEEYESLSKDDRQLYMNRSPFEQVKIAEEVYREIKNRR